MADKQVPSIGRVVHYVAKAFGFHRPAIIVNIPDQDSDAFVVNLIVFFDGKNDLFGDDQVPVLWRESVKLDDDTKEEGTWHWPEYVPPVKDGA